MALLGFVLKPDMRTINTSIELNNQIPNSELVLDKNFFLPHVTVLQANIRNSFDYKKVLREARTYPGFKQELKTTTGDIYQDNNYVMWGLKNDRWLEVFNQYLVHVAAPHISVPEPTKPFRTPQQEKSYNLTGYIYNLEAYSPHITLGVTDVETVLPQPASSRILFHELLFCEHGLNGKIQRVIDRQPLPVSWD